ncbi:hypothetical protein HDU79_005737 [Rhizoclosmatium sp. JEL0117]|nr:hypothetical protein HDU79_005737 [Rhizoclosmatium sp. JEL0117]
MQKERAHSPLLLKSSKRGIIIILALLVVLAGIVGAVMTVTRQSILTATSAASFLPFASSPLLSGSIEGASVMCDGSFVAVGASSAIRLDTGKVLVSGGIGQFASSRFIGNDTFLIGDASTPHTVYSASLDSPPAIVGTDSIQPLWAVNPDMLQPNDFTLDKTFTRMYLSGMRYSDVSTAGVDGELWYFNFQTKALVKVPSSVLAAANIHRTNGIELSPDNQSLYVTSAQNGPPSAAQIFKFEINPSTGLPETPIMVVDVFEELSKLGIDWTGMDPDGMKADLNGVLHLTLNGGGRVFRYNPSTKAVQIILLENMTNPSNLQFGGEDGKRLVVIGHGCDGDWSKSCAEWVDLDAPGRDITELRNSGNC